MFAQDTTQTSHVLQEGASGDTEYIVRAMARDYWLCERPRFLQLVQTVEASIRANATRPKFVFRATDGAIAVTLMNCLVKVDVAAHPQSLARASSDVPFASFSQILEIRAAIKSWDGDARPARA